MKYSCKIQSSKLQKLPISRPDFHLLFPSTKTLDKIIRYENSLSRQLFQAMDQLETPPAPPHWRKCPASVISASA